MTSPQSGDGRKQDFLPALKGKHGLRLYDPLIRVTMREYAFKRRLIQQAKLVPGNTILDAGCGTGTLLALIQESHPGVRLAGLDMDARILHRARAKTATPLSRGTATSLPFAAASFDYVFSTLVFHHLRHEEKIQAFKEILRVLRPDGWLHAADFGKPQNGFARVMGKLVQLEDGAERTQDNFAGLLLGMLERAGFAAAREWEHRMTLFGTLALFSAKKPG